MITILNDRYLEVCNELIKRITNAKAKSDKKTEAVESLKLANFRVAYFEQFVPEYHAGQWGRGYYESQVYDNLWLKQKAIDLCLDADVDTEKEDKAFDFSLFLVENKDNF